MFERVCLVRTALVSSIAVLGDNEMSKITDAEFETTKNVSASKVIVLVGLLKEHLAHTDNVSSGDVKEIARRMLADIRERYRMLERQSALTIPTFLDPRFKKKVQGERSAGRKFRMRWLFYSRKTTKRRKWTFRRNHLLRRARCGTPSTKTPEVVLQYVLA